MRYCSSCFSSTTSSKTGSMCLSRNTSALSARELMVELFLGSTGGFYVAGSGSSVDWTEVFDCSVSWSVLYDVRSEANDTCVLLLFCGMCFSSLS